eukprot:TRINITY_DN7494_c0_g1_i1.p1 TRINITY_DN7494_c0_g1~~TRINITY_DN7494_c0_g1_i1.p1  ORF type:complete len:246 (-),score=20.27 TRINITY_DN7494_c0_g1_i1:126-863(-)
MRRICIQKFENTTLRSLICPITLDVYVDPVVAADGNTYERKAIEEWFQLSGHNPRSPLTNEPLPHTSLTPNNILKSILPEKPTSPYVDDGLDPYQFSSSLCTFCRGTSICIRCKGKGFLEGLDYQEIRCDACEGAAVCSHCESEHIRKFKNDNKFNALFGEQYELWQEFLAQGIGKIIQFVKRNWKLMTIGSLTCVFVAVMCYLRYPSGILFNQAQVIFRALISSILVSTGGLSARLSCSLRKIA